MSANPYLIPIRTNNNQPSHQQQKKATPSSSSSTTILLSSSYPTTTSSNLQVPPSSQTQTHSQQNILSGNNNRNNSSGRSDWLFTGASTSQNIVHQNHHVPQKPKNSNNSSNNNSRRASIERGGQEDHHHDAPVVVRLKNATGSQERHPSAEDRFQTTVKSSSKIVNNRRGVGNANTNKNRNNNNDDDDIDRFIYEDNGNNTDVTQFLNKQQDRAETKANTNSIQNSDGSPIHSLDDVKDIMPPVTDDAAKELAKMIQEQGRALLQIREKENELKQKQREQDEQEERELQEKLRNYSPSTAARRVLDSSNLTKPKETNSNLLPATFAPVPPSRWRLPPTLPPRQRLLTDGPEGQPRLDLLDMLEKLDQEDEEKEHSNNKNKKQHGSQSSSSSINTGSRITSELWIYIFEFLDPRSLCLCSEVSKRWMIISRSEYLWQPILNNDFQHLIQEEDEERRFQERTASLSAAPPRPATNSNDNMCPSLTRISTFVAEHRGRIQHELTSIETRIQQTEDRILHSQRLQSSSHQQQHQQATNNSNNNNNNNQVLSGLERELTNERSVLLRQLQELEPKVRQLFDRLRDAEATQATQSRSLNEAIVSSKRSGLQLQAIHRRSQIADRRHKERTALEDLERRLCLLVLDGAGNLLPISLKKSIRTFSQLELLLMSCANQESLASLPKRWEKVKEGVSIELIDEMKKQIDDSEDVNGVLGKLLLISKEQQQQQELSSFMMRTASSPAAAASSSASKTSTGDSNRIRFADSLLNRRKQNQNQQNDNNNNKNTNNKSNSTTMMMRTFSEDHELVKKRLIAEMALRMLNDDVSLEKFLFP